MLYRSRVGLHVAITKNRWRWDVFVPTRWMVMSKCVSGALVEVRAPHGAPRRSALGMSLAVRVGVGRGELPQNEQNDERQYTERGA